MNVEKAVEPAGASHVAAGGPPGLPKGSVPAGGRRHSPGMALVAGLLIPGAGQAYNGRPIAGFFVCFLSILVLPWLVAAFTAFSGARRIAAAGGRFGRGGFVWVILQAWLVFNVALAVLLGLTIAGVVS